jgi:hypothetical protein
MWRKGEKYTPEIKEKQHENRARSDTVLKSIDLNSYINRCQGSEKIKLAMVIIGLKF